MVDDKKPEEELDPYMEMVSEKSPYLFCDVCEFYPINPVHGHFVCPQCHHVTRCCDGAPADV